jgi:peptidoglycan L-alanyl-D-glutamate endopeptidase CwlK
MDMVAVEDSVVVDGWFGSKSLKLLESLEPTLLNSAVGIVINQTNTEVEHKLSSTSLKRLKGVHPDIVKVVKRASLYAPIFVVEGMRSQKRQNKLKKKGKSHISRSYHLYGLAVDLVLLVKGKIDWDNKSSYKRIHKAINRAEKELGINVLDSAMFDLHWKTLTDYPHWQMSSRYVPNRNPRKYYADKKYKGFVV